MSDKHPLAGKTTDDLLQLGETICSPRDWRWCAHWACSLHREFRPHFKQRSYWVALDELLANELEWHRGKELFECIRRESTSKSSNHTAETTHDILAEIGAKCISNASWDPGLYDYDAPYEIPGLVIRLTVQLALPEKERRFAFRFTALAFQSHPRPRKERE